MVNIFSKCLNPYFYIFWMFGLVNIDLFVLFRGWTPSIFSTVRLLECRIHFFFHFYTSAIFEICPVIWGPTSHINTSLISFCLFLFPFLKVIFVFLGNTPKKERIFFVGNLWSRCIEFKSRFIWEERRLLTNL